MPLCLYMNCVLTMQQQVPLIISTFIYCNMFLKLSTYRKTNFDVKIYHKFIKFYVVKHIVNLDFFILK